MSRSTLFLPIERRLSRRAILAGVAASALAGVTALARIPTALGRTPGGDDVIQDVCYWETVRTDCSNGRKLEYRCEVCCAGGICETVQCLWFDAGPC